MSGHSKERIIREIATGLANSEYGMEAPGLRVVSYPELIEVVKILRYSKKENILKELKLLHKYRPETITMDKSFAKYNCDKFNESVCDCFLPDVEFENCYCKMKRKEYLEKTDYRNTPEYNKWRRLVFERDGFTCQNCGTVGGDLNAHHIHTYKKYPGERFDIENGKTLCVKCHRLEHKKGV